MKLTFDVPKELAEKIGKEIKTALDEYKKSKPFPQAGDEYYFLDGAGYVQSDHYIGNYIDYARINIGNIFKTQEKAVFRAEQLKVLHELEQLADDDQDWNQNHTHWDIFFDHASSIVRPDYHGNNKYTQYMFKSKESAQAAIDKIGEDRLKKYYFGVKE